MENPSPSLPSFRITKNAAKRICHLLILEAQEQKLENLAFRIEINGGGCSGYQYHFAFSSEQTTEDIFIEEEGAKVVIDPVSLDLLKGSVLDYEENLMGAHFKIENPNATTSCGCGSSFSVF